MFTGSLFDRDISTWDVSNVINTRAMFSSSKFNRDISKWNLPVEKIIELGEQMSGNPEWLQKFKYEHRGILAGKKFNF
jgi:hypothetical protein